MKQIFLFLAIPAFFNSYGQDLIVTTDQDSIECKINKQDSEYIYFTYQTEDSTSSVLLENERISEVVLDFYEHEVAVIAPDSRNTGGEAQEFTRFHISGSLIASRRIAPVSNELPEFVQDYFEELKGGNGYQGRFHVFINDESGIGIQVSTYETSHSIIGEFTFEQPDSVAVGAWRTDVSLLYIGPSYMGRYFFPGSSFMINYSFSIGYLRFRQEELFIDSRTTFEGSSLGLNGDFGLEYFLAKNFALGIGVGYGLGSISNITVTQNGQSEDVELEEPEGLARISIFGGVRFHL